jgi:radial spoke head protein 4A
MLSMKGLVESAPLEFVRLWGKVLGVHADYYVVESRFKDGEAPDSDAEGAEEEDDGQQGAGEDEDDVAPEEDEENQEETGLGKIKKKIGWGEVPKEKGEGVNKFTYWVTTQLGGAWTRLPNITPRQIMAARKIRRFLTGDLSHDVASYPPFPGTEAALLRAQIARITHATAISPRGYFVADEAADEGAYAVVKNDEYEPPSMEELVDPETWVHHEPKILLQGRARHFAPEMPEDEGEEDEEGKKKDEREPLPAEFLPEEAPEPLAPITGDAELVPEVIPAWSARNCSVHQPQYGAAALHSNVWPGAVVVAKGKEFASLYVGYGLKYNPEPFTPEPLPAVQADPPEDEEAPEPDFREEYERWLKTQRKQDNDNEDGEQEEDEEED